MNTNSINDGGPAFPLPIGNESFFPSVAGMTLRDYFAGQAMQGLIAQSLGTALDASSSGRELGAQFSYRIADAMLLARSKT